MDRAINTKGAQMDTSKKLSTAELKALLAGITPGPWLMEPQLGTSKLARVVVPDVGHINVNTGILTTNNARAIAQVPALLAEVIALREALYSAAWWLDLSVADLCPSDDLRPLDYDGQKEWVENKIRAALAASEAA